MRIISDFHDYYDGAMALGQDTSVVFKRKTTIAHAAVAHLPWTEFVSHGVTANDVITLTRASPHFAFPMSWRPGHPAQHEAVGLHRSLLLLGGRAIELWSTTDGSIGGATPEAAIRALVKTWPDKLPDEVRTASSALGPVRDLVPASCLKELGFKRRGSVKASKQEDILRRGLNLRFEEAVKKDWTDMHLALNAPILLFVASLQPPFFMMQLAAPDQTNLSDQSQQPDGTPWVMPDRKGQSSAVNWSQRAGVEIYARRRPGTTVPIIRNPCLNRLGIAAVLDPFACFQTLSQFIGGVAPGRSMPMVTISDKDQIKKKGFDPVYGFRRRPAP